ncbi:MAG: Rid family detoxifying hydrolase [Myxococcales bacterium]|nr:Rid family detoxifying hydrolase [Myxococcales bacterium]
MSDKKIIHTDAAPAAIGPYSQAVRVAVKDLVFCSGQIGLDPATGAMAEGVEAQARCALANLKAVLHAAGARLDDVVRTTVYLADMGDFARVNAIYQSYFDGAAPARAAVQAAGLPKGALVEVDAIAAVRG